MGATGTYFAEVVKGIEDLAAVELEELGAADVRPGDGGLRLRHERPSDLLDARMVAAVYRELRFAVSRPKALLGDAAARRLALAVAEVARAPDGHAMRSFRLAAAGSDSAVFRRLAAELERVTGLREDSADGEVLIRVRPYRDVEGGGWEVLVRLTPRPSSTRAWRTCNRPGGLNATVAVAVNELLGVAAGGSYLNLMCGSGTLLVERALTGRYKRLVGVDSDANAVACSAENLASARVGADAELVVADVRDPELPSRLLGGVGSGGAAETAAAVPVGRGLVPVGFSAIAVDAPWGDAVGSHAENEELHDAVFGQARRLLAPDGRFALVTHEVRLLRRLLERHRGWRVVSRRQVAHGGHNPVLLVLERVQGDIQRL